MALNLNALKNIPVVGASTSPKTGNIPLPTIQGDNKISLSADGNNTIPEMEKVTEKIPSTGPKISLMKLKQNSQGETSTMQPVQEPIVENIEQEISLAEIAEQAEKKQNISPVNAIETPLQTEVEGIKISDVLSLEIEGKEEAYSIFSNVETEAIPSEEEIILEQTPSKEFFPNFHISNELGLDNDLLNLNLDSNEIIKDHGDISISIEKSSQVKAIDVTAINPEIQEIIETTVPVLDTKDLEIIEIEATDILEPSVQESSMEVISETITSEKIPEDILITPEYVAEVKTELSEQRRAGFRFFVQKNTKIMAGVSFLIIAIGVFFSSSLFSTDIQKSRKSNIQEVIKNTPVPPVVTENTTSGAISEPVISTDVFPLESTNYEAGRDYTIIKNTKKNIPRNSVVESVPNAEVPTP